MFLNFLDFSYFNLFFLILYIKLKNDFYHIFYFSDFLLKIYIIKCNFKMRYLNNYGENTSDNWSAEDIIRELCWDIVDRGLYIEFDKNKLPSKYILNVLKCNDAKARSIAIHNDYMKNNNFFALFIFDKDYKFVKSPWSVYGVGDSNKPMWLLDTSIIRSFLNDLHEIGFEYEIAITLADFICILFKSEDSIMRTINL